MSKVSALYPKSKQLIIFRGRTISVLSNARQSGDEPRLRVTACLAEWPISRIVGPIASSGNDVDFKIVAALQIPTTVSLCVVHTTNMSMEGPANVRLKHDRPLRVVLCVCPSVFAKHHPALDVHSRRNEVGTLRLPGAAPCSHQFMLLRHASPAYARLCIVCHPNTFTFLTFFV